MYYSCSYINLYTYIYIPELLMMAEMVAGDRKREETDSDAMESKIISMRILFKWHLKWRLEMIMTIHLLI